MAWYNIGTVAVTNNGTTVTGTGTNWTQYVDAGQGFRGPDGLIYEIATVNSATQITLATAYKGATASGQAYSISPEQGYIRDLALQAADLILSFAIVRDNAGAGMFTDGTAAAPGVRFANDQDTGIYRIGTNVLGIATNGTERVRVDGSGNVGVGTSSPAARHHVSTAGASVARFTNTQSNGGDWEFKLGGGGFIDRTFMLTDKFGGADNVRLAVSGSGKVGIGTTSPSETLHLYDSVASNWVVQRIENGAGWMKIGAVATSGDAYVESASGKAFRIKENGTDRVIVASGGNVGIGVSPGSRLHIDGHCLIQSTGTFAGMSLRNSNDSGAAETVSFIDFSNNLAIADSHLFFRHRTDGSSQFEVGLTPVGSRSSDRRAAKFSIDPNGAYSGGDNTMTFGWSGNRWQAIHAVNGAIQTSDEREKKWRGSLNEAELEASRLIAKEIGIFQWLQSIEEKGEDAARFHTGVPAQTAFRIIESCGLDWRRYAWACYDEWVDVVQPVYERREVEKTEEIEVDIPTAILGPDGQPITRKEKALREWAETEYVETGETEVVTPAGNRCAIRPDQLAFWIIAGQEQRLSAFEARLAALEAA